MNIIKPRALRCGMTIGLVAPSSALPEPKRLPLAVSRLEAAGFRVQVGRSCVSRHGYLAGTDEERADDINRMFRDDTIDAILCARGGYGATRILPLIDYDAIAAHPKVFSGFSDITALHGAIFARTGLVTFHGAMAVSDFGADNPDEFSLNSFFQTVSNPASVGIVNNPAGYGREALCKGRALGRLIGGNLSLLASCLGTPYDVWRAFEDSAPWKDSERNPDHMRRAFEDSAPWKDSERNPVLASPDGAILFIEDVGEKTYAIDRMLTQLYNAGVFARCAGVALGDFSGCDPQHPDTDFSLREVLRDRFTNIGVPVLAGIRCGHCVPRLTLPFGVRCELDADARTLAVLESAVV